MSKKSNENTRNSAAMKIMWRYVLVSTLVVLFAATIAYFELRTTVIDAHLWIDKANEELNKHEKIAPARGDILAADGSILATNMNFYTMRIDFKASKFSETKYRESLDSLCDTLAVRHPHRTREEWYAFMTRELEKKPNERSSSFTFLRNLTYTQAQEVKNYPYFRRSKNRNRTGLIDEKIERRSYPYGDMARRSVGRVGQTAECDEVHGISGLEYALDQLLYGKEGIYKRVALTKKIVNWVDSPAEAGATVTTTIDIGMQDIVECELAEALKSYDAEWGTVVLMEVATGDIKAISNLEKSDNGTYIESMNHAVLGFEPGSVMKTISMVIALEDGFTRDPETEYYNIPGGGYRFGGGSPIRDTHSPPSLPVSRFLEYSSNIGMTMLVAPHYKDNPNGFRERIAQMGLLDKLGTGIAEETPPYFPKLDIRSGGLTSLGRQTYGYASRISPLYVCAFYNAIANNGDFVRPRLVSKLQKNGVDSVIPVTYVRRNICSHRHAAQVREMLHKVIYGQGGTAKALKDPVIDIAGKTGTSKIARELSQEDLEKYKKNPKDPTIKHVKGYEDGAYRYSFCGFFPYAEPKYTCMVMVSRPGNHVVRNAGVISGGILLNIARRMHSRGMLGDTPDYRTGEPTTSPVLYATTDATRDGDLKAMLGSSHTHRLSTPRRTRENTIPDVSGLGLREAIVVIEKAGYNIDFKGDGTVIAQTPPAGTPAKPGTKVSLTMQKR